MANPVLIALAGCMMFNITPQGTMSSPEVKAIACDPWYDNYVSFKRKIVNTYWGEPTYIREAYNFGTTYQQVTGQGSREAFYESSLSTEVEIGTEFAKLSHATEVTLGQSKNITLGYILVIPDNSVARYELGNKIAYEKMSYGYYTNRCEWVEREIIASVEYSYGFYESFYDEPLS